MLYSCYTSRATTRGELFSTATSPPAREFKKIAADGENRLLQIKINKPNSNGIDNVYGLGTTSPKISLKTID